MPITLGYPETKPNLAPDFSGNFPDELEALVRESSKSKKHHVGMVIGGELGRGVRELTGYCDVVYALFPEGFENFNLFVSNCWGHRARIIPVRGDYSKTLSLLASQGVRPDLIFVNEYHENIPDLIGSCHDFFGMPATIVGTYPQSLYGVNQLHRRLTVYAELRNTAVQHKGYVSWLI